MWDVFKDWIFNVIQFFYDFCGDWGLAIIIVTIIFRILVAPLMHKQAKSNFQMQKIQPQIQKIQEKYASDQPRMQQEMQRLYAEAKFNPLAGCLPMLLQMPIFIDGRPSGGGGQLHLLQHRSQPGHDACPGV